MVSAFPLCLLLLGVSVVSSQVTPSTEELDVLDQTPIADRRTFKKIKAVKFLKKQKKFGGLFPHSYGRTEYREIIASPRPIYKVHRYRGIEVKPVHSFDVQATHISAPETIIESQAYGPPVNDFEPTFTSGPSDTVFPYPPSDQPIHSSISLPPPSLPVFLTPPAPLPSAPIFSSAPAQLPPAPVFSSAPAPLPPKPAFSFIAIPAPVSVLPPFSVRLPQAPLPSSPAFSFVSFPKPSLPLSPAPSPAPPGPILSTPLPSPGPALSLPAPVPTPSALPPVHIPPPRPIISSTPAPPLSIPISTPAPVPSGPIFNPISPGFSHISTSLPSPPPISSVSILPPSPPVFSSISPPQPSPSPIPSVSILPPSPPSFILPPSPAISSFPVFPSPPPVLSSVTISPTPEPEFPYPPSGVPTTSYIKDTSLPESSNEEPPNVEAIASIIDDSKNVDPKPDFGLLQKLKGWKADKANAALNHFSHFKHKPSFQSLPIPHSVVTDKIPVNIQGNLPLYPTAFPSPIRPLPLTPDFRPPAAFFPSSPQNFHPIKYESFPPNHVESPPLYNSYGLPIPHDSYAPPTHFSHDRVAPAASEEDPSILPAPPAFTDKKNEEDVKLQQAETQPIEILLELQTKNVHQSDLHPEFHSQEQPVYVPEESKTLAEDNKSTKETSPSNNSSYQENNQTQEEKTTEVTDVNLRNDNQKEE